MTQSCSDDLSQDSMCTQQLVGDVEETTLSQQSTGSKTDLKDIVETQQREIEKLNTVINSLSAKVSFLLSFLGIEEQASSNDSSAAIAAGVTHPGINKSATSAGSSQLLSSSVVNNSNTATPTFADQVKNTPVYQAVVSTVCSLIWRRMRQDVHADNAAPIYRRRERRAEQPNGWLPANQRLIYDRT